MTGYEQSSLPDWYQRWQIGLGATEEQYKTTNEGYRASEHATQGCMICSSNLWGWDIRKAPPTSSQSLLPHIHSWSYNYHISKKTSHGSPWLPEIQQLPNPDPALSHISLPSLFSLYHWLQAHGAYGVLTRPLPLQVLFPWFEVFPHPSLSAYLLLTSSAFLKPRRLPTDRHIGHFLPRSPVWSLHLY